MINQNLTLDEKPRETTGSGVQCVVATSGANNVYHGAESPLVLSLSMLLTGKTDHLLMVSDSYDLKDMYRAQWKHVQALSDIFWREWRVSYLQSLQARRKWFTTTPNLKDGDIVLLKDKAAQRISWPLGIVVKALPSEDSNFRKACVRIYKDGKTVTYIRPINEMVLLLK